VAVALVLVSVAPRPATAGPVQDLNDARSLVRRGKYKQAIPKLNYLLYPRARLAARSDLIEAHVLLGVSYFESGDKTSAEPEFEKALFLDSTLTLDELLFSKGAIEFFNKKKHKLDAQRRKDEKQRQLAADLAYYKKLALQGLTLEKNSRAVSFIPFGVGQFQNDDTRAGTVFLISQLVTGGTSAGIWLWQVLKYGFSGAVPLEEAGTVRTLQQIEIVSGGMCLALMIWGIVDAQRHFQASKLKRGIDVDLLKQLFNRPTGGGNSPPASPLKKSKPSSLRLLPTVGPRSAGVALSWEF